MSDPFKNFIRKVEMSLQLVEIDKASRKLCKDANKVLKGQAAYLVDKCSKYNGRRGVIAGVMPGTGGELTALLMITKLGSDEALNDKPETRQYRPLSQVSLAGHRGRLR